MIAYDTNDSLAETYGYDALGRRVWISDGSTTNYLVYDGIQVVAEVDSSGSLQRSYTYGPSVDDILAMSVYTNSGGTSSTSSVFFYVKDHLGSVIAIVDETGTNVVERYEYDAWGNVTAYDGDDVEIDESQIGNRYLWQGREYSWTTGLYNFRARWYDPVTGRWLSKDPIGISGGLNQYVFCGNNGVGFVDPWGLCKDDSWTERTWVGVYAESDGAFFIGRHGGAGVLMNVADPTKTAPFSIAGWKFGGGAGGSVGAHIIVVVNAPENIRGFKSESGGADWDFSLAGKWDSAVKSTKGVGAAYELIKAHKKLRYATETIIKNRGILGGEETKVISVPVPLAGVGVNIWGGYKTTSIEVQ